MAATTAGVPGLRGPFDAGRVGGEAANPLVALREQRQEVGAVPGRVRGVVEHGEHGGVPPAFLCHPAQAGREPVERTRPAGRPARIAAAQLRHRPREQGQHVRGAVVDRPHQRQRLADRAVDPASPVQLDGRAGEQRDRRGGPQGELPFRRRGRFQHVRLQVVERGGDHPQRDGGVPQPVPVERLRADEDVVEQVVQRHQRAPREPARVDELPARHVLVEDRRRSPAAAQQQPGADVGPRGAAVDHVEERGEPGVGERVHHPARVRAAHPAAAHHERDPVPVRPVPGRHPPQQRPQHLVVARQAHLRPGESPVPTRRVPHPDTSSCAFRHAGIISRAATARPPSSTSRERASRS